MLERNESALFSNADKISPTAQLIAGCRELNYDKVAEAIKRGADVNAKSPCTIDGSYIYNNQHTWYTPLSLVAKQSHGITDAHEIFIKICAIAELLLNNEANLDALDKGDMGNSPLHWAIVTLNKKLCKLFISHAINKKSDLLNQPNQPEEEYFGINTPLILALKVSCRSLLLDGFYDLEVAELLIKNGADINAINYYKQSALHWASILRLPEKFFDLLITNGAEHRPDKFNNDPIKLYKTQITYKMIDYSSAPTSFRDIDYHLPCWYDSNDIRLPYRQSFINQRNDISQPHILQLLESNKQMQKNSDPEPKSSYDLSY
ncbi:MAG: ankyrin repeat domain-containing protein [Gammaproteobacteria bacterium]|nr:ankyrin repeat domain-containing protein [Gammaproteobacteria bacterium]